MHHVLLTGHGWGVDTPLPRDIRTWVKWRCTHVNTVRLGCRTLRGNLMATAEACGVHKLLSECYSDCALRQGGRWQKLSISITGRIVQCQNGETL